MGLQFDVIFIEFFMDDDTYVRDVEDCVQYDLLRTRVHLLCL